MISITLDFIPVIGDVKSIIEATVGYDLAGNKLSQTERTLMLLGGIVGMFTVFDEIADVARLGSKLLDNGDEVIDVLRASKGLDNIDEVVDVGRSLDNVAELAEVGRGLDHIDEITDVGRNLDNLDGVAEVSRNLDNLDEATDLARTNNQLDNLDDLMGEQRVFSQAETRAALTDGADSGTLNETLTQKQTEKLRTNLEESKAAREASGFRQWVEDVESKALGGSTDNTPRVAIELGPGTKDNLVNIAEARPNVQVIGIEYDPMSATLIERQLMIEPLADRIKLVQGNYLKNPSDLGVPLGDEVISVAPGPAPFGGRAGIEYPKNAAQGAANVVAEKGQIYIVSDLINDKAQANEVAQVAINKLNDRGLKPTNMIVEEISHEASAAGKNPLGIPLTSVHLRRPDKKLPWAIYIDLR